MTGPPLSGIWLSPADRKSRNQRGSTMGLREGVGRRRALGTVGAAALLAASIAVGSGGAPAGAAPAAPPSGKLLFFASDGLRQDAVKKFSNEGVTPGYGALLDSGAFASGNGLLTQAPPNTGAGWFSVSTGAGPPVHGAQHHTLRVQ